MLYHVLYTMSGHKEPGDFKRAYPIGDFAYVVGVYSINIQAGALKKNRV